MEPEHDDVDAWAAEERRRRQEWLNGPSEEEKAEWARARAARRAEPTRPEPISQGDAEEELLELARRALRQAELAGKGSLWAFSRAPFLALSYLVRAGRAFDEEMSRPPRKGRVPY
jgi:hypothetical protein